MPATHTDGDQEQTRRQYWSYWLRRRFPSLQATERVGLGIVAVLLTIAVAFVILYWFQTHGYASGLYRQFLTGGELLDLLLGTNIFRHPPVWHAIAAGVLAGVTVPLVGTFMVHREQALIGETLAHTAFAGLAAGVVFRGYTGIAVPPALVALGVSICGALGLQWLTAHSDASGDVPLAIVLVGSFALGTLLISHGEGTMPLAIEVEAYLFGSGSIVTAMEARLMTAISLFVIVTIALYHKQFLYLTFDTPAARAAGIDATRYSTVLLVLAAAVVVGSMQILGVILVAGLLVVPVATATHVATSFRELVILSILYGEFVVITGLVLSMIAGVPSGGLIIFLAILLYLAAVFRSGGSLRSVRIQ